MTQDTTRLHGTASAAPPDAGLDDFAPEGAAANAAPTHVSIRLDRRVAKAAWVSLILALAFAGSFVATTAAGAYRAGPWLPVAQDRGTLRIVSNPPGAEVRLGGVMKGRTPVTLALAPGSHALTLVHGAATRALAVTIAHGVETVHHVEWPMEPEPAGALTGSVSVATDAPGARVALDGIEQGVTPLILEDVAAGEHEVAVRLGGVTHRRTVQVEAGATASLLVSRGVTGAPTGWLSVSAPAPLQIFEDGRLLGTTEVDRIMLPTGEHEFEIVSEPLGFRAIRAVSIAAGQTAELSIQLPRAPISVNAVPWAEVFIDGRRVGETPLANLMQPLGPREVVFRHPQFGERRVTALVTLTDVARVSVDMRQK